MTDVDLIECFHGSWEYIRDMRDAFIKCVPDDKWHFTHHPKFAPLVKQFKHLIKVYGCYIDALETQRLDMAKKSSMFRGPETRENILALLHDLDHKLDRVLSNLKRRGLDGYRVSLFGMNMDFSAYTHVMIHHDTSHFGMWANYAAFGGFDTPATWQQDWKL